VSDSLIRPGNATPYGIGDAVTDTSGRVLRFDMVPRVLGGGGYIPVVRITGDTANVANAFFRLYIYSDSLAAAADNAAFPLSPARWKNAIGYVNLALTTEGSGSTAASDVATQVGLMFWTQTDRRTLDGVLVAQGAYVPKWFGKFYVTLGIHRI
jgi:hypothetical protein